MGRSAGDIAATDVDIDAYSHIGGDSYPNYYRDANHYGDTDKYGNTDNNTYPIQNADTNNNTYPIQNADTNGIAYPIQNADAWPYSCIR